MPDPKPSQVQSGARPTSAPAEAPAYSRTARTLHWATVVFVLCQIPVGLIMRGRAERNVWDGLTNTLYSSHKLAGLTVLALVAARLVYRLVHGAPPDEPTIEPWQKVVSHVVHWALYALLLAVPLLGWLGISLYPALDIFGLFKVPGLVAPNQPKSEVAFFWHKIGAFTLIGLVAMHFGAAMFHAIVRKDGVLRRMWPGS